MKCAKIVSPKLIETTTMDEPVSKDGYVVVKVNKAGICGSDIHNWDIGAPEGLVLGHEFSGTVVDPGSRSDLKIGDRVTALPISPCDNCPACQSDNHQYCPDTWTNALGLSLTHPGAYAEMLAYRPELIVKLPDSISNDEGAMIEPTAVALHAVNLAEIKEGDNVLVIGAGIIGDLCALLAKKKGAKYVAISETNGKRGEKAVKLGAADAWFNAKNENFINDVRANCPYGYDVVLDCCGNSPAVTSAIVSARPNGTVVLVGVSLQNINIPSAVIVTHELKVYGAIAYTKDEFNKCADLIANKEIDVIKFIDDIVSLDNTQDAFLRLTSGEDDAIKILIDTTL